jgi:hypothetical protein
LYTATFASCVTSFHLKLEEAVLQAGEGTSGLLHTSSHVGVVLAVRVQHATEPRTEALRRRLNMDAFSVANTCVWKILAVGGAAVDVGGPRRFVVEQHRLGLPSVREA